MTSEDKTKQAATLPEDALNQFEKVVGCIIADLLRSESAMERGVGVIAHFLGCIDERLREIADTPGAADAIENVTESIDQLRMSVRADIEELESAVREAGNVG